MITLTRRELLKSIAALAAWAGLGPLQHAASAPVPPAALFGFPLTFPAAFLEEEAGEESSYTTYLPQWRSE